MKTPRLPSFFGTLCGAIAGVLAIIIWIATFEPHGGPELSHYLFPLSAVALERMFPETSIPVPLWYGGALLQWIVVGAVVDLVRRVLTEKQEHGKEA